MLGLAGWCFLMGWGFRVGLLRMALSLGAVGLLVLYWPGCSADSEIGGSGIWAAGYSLASMCVISIGYFGTPPGGRELGYDSRTVRINHAGGLLPWGWLIGALVWVLVI